MSSKDKSILIVDDDSRNIFALSAVLRSKGYTVTAASSIKEAFEKLNSDNIGAILLDMMMPDMDGYEAIPLIRQKEQYGNMPVIAVTAQAMPGDREKCLAAGADDYISKPVDVDVLLEALQRRI
jgi:two-component system cell cycle response regulator DivK